VTIVVNFNCNAQGIATACMIHFYVSEKYGVLSKLRPCNFPENMVIFQVINTKGVSMKETEIINILRTENEVFRKFEEEHRKLDKTLDEMTKKRYLTTEEELEKKKLQKQKLHYKDQMAQLIREYQKVKN